MEMDGMAEAGPGGEQDFAPGFAGQYRSALLLGEVFDLPGGAAVEGSIQCDAGSKRLRILRERTRERGTRTISDGRPPPNSGRCI